MKTKCVCALFRQSNFRERFLLALPEPRDTLKTRIVFYADRFEFFIKRLHLERARAALLQCGQIYSRKLGLRQHAQCTTRV